MIIAARIWRFLLWTFGCLFTIAIGSTFLDFKFIARSTSRGSLRLTIVILSIYLIAALLGPIAAIGLKRGRTWGRRMGWITAVVQTLALPIFTPLGLFGLVMMILGAGSMPSETTPEEDKQKLSDLPHTILLVALIGGLNVFFYDWSKRLGYPASGLSYNLLVLPITLVVSIFLHESGHALAGKWQGGHLHGFRVGPVGWRRESGRTWWEVNWKRALGGVIYWTPGSREGIPQQQLWVALGGPLVDLCVGLVALALFPWLSAVGLANAWPWVMCAAVISLGSGIGNLIPFLHGYSETDGTIVWGILTSANYRRLEEFMLGCEMSESSALRPREWNGAELAWTLAQTWPVPRRSRLLHLAMEHHLDKGDSAGAVDAARQFDALAKQHPKACLPTGYPGAVFVLASYGGDPQAARELWERRPKGRPVQFDLTEHLALAALGDADEIQRARRCSASYATSGTLEFLREQLRMLESGQARSIAALALAVGPPPLPVEEAMPQQHPA